MKKGIKKRGFFVAFFIALLVLTFFVSAQEEMQIKRVYSWLQTKTLGKWNALSTKEHVFSLLALQEKLSISQKNASLKALIAKSKDNACWPQASCNAVETAIAKIALDNFALEFPWLETSSEKASDWLLNKTIVFMPENFYLQIIQPAKKEILCIISYDTGSCEIKVKSDDKIEMQACSCFSSETYWLKVRTECARKNFSITCNESAFASFLFKKDNEWFVTSSVVSVPLPPSNASIGITSYCIGDSTCDYEATLWTAYAFRNEKEKAKIFLPYLVMQAETEKRFLPEAFLYAITGKEIYSNKVAALQGNDGFVLAPGSAYNKYYDSAIAKIMNVAINETKLKEKLMREQRRDGSWSCSGLSNCNEIRENSLIVYAFWPSYLSLLPECEQQGLTCVTNCSSAGGKKENYECDEGKECCNLSSYSCEERYGTCMALVSCPSGYVKVPYSCKPEQICCKPYNISACVSEINGKFCQINQQCSGNAVVSAEYPTQERCCLGSCVAMTQTCSELDGEICQPPLSCPYDKQLSASDTLYCCMKNFCLPSEQQTCSQQNGRKCLENEICTGTSVVASDTQGKANCCIGGTCIAERCKAEDKLCERDERCVGGRTYESEEGICCESPGSCLKSCSALHGVPCNASMTCKGQIVRSSDFSRCCLGECKKKAKFPFWIIIIVAAAIAAFYFFFIRKKPEEEKEEFPLAQFPRPTPFKPMPRQIPKPPSKPVSIQKVPAKLKEKIAKREKAELKETLEKLKKMQED
ncbi:MAG: hypothetical protein QW585_00895 [Candidatus Pacearchaeota archaeon]